jgi:phosphoglycerate dehydrogenase-like enzyme
MSRQRKVVSLAPAGLDFIFDPIVAGLRARGYQVTHFTDFAKFGQVSDAVLKDAEALVVLSNFPCGKALMKKAPHLLAIVSPFIGTEGIDEVAATELGIMVANGQVPENVLSMSESTLMLILVSLYSLHWWQQQLRENRPHPAQVPGRMIRGRTLGMIGCGQIARGIVARLAGWEVQVQTYIPRLRTPPPPGVKRVSLEELLQTSDVVCVLAPLNAETRGMLDLGRLRLMKPDAVLINTARGGIVDEAALVQVARERPHLKIAIDTFAEEPLPPGSPLRQLPNAILTPHAIGHTQESIDALPTAAIENVSRILQGELPLYLRNPDVIPQWRRRFAELGNE